MKRLIFILFPLFLNAQSFIEIIKKVDQNEQLRAKEYEIKAKKEILNLNRGKNLPSIDALLQAVYLQEEPKMYLHLGIPNIPTSFPSASINQYIGEITLSYPIFTGFALTYQIEKSKIDLEKSKLQKKDIKRNLYIKTAFLYSQIFALNEAIKAAKEALRAIDVSYKKAKGFYKQGLIAPN
jgi:outer membrane protein TolC